ncbi:MAG: ATP-binding cassette domain-containing protein [Clostridiales bacterium]|nr:ATP-binding cassette domain-containing protein [Clostridiales bacterium]
MGMIRLKNVSKFYYSKGIIASGISKVNLDLDVGEFVVITGESGSGKSTLLNVISGLDSYEEGEMYIEGSETSHYTASDFEDYRQKYISCIFQSFNLVSSYTVFQNVALAMQIDGRSPEEIKKKVPEIIEKVGLSAYKNRKVSKLSGGQKQRVAIARALAKDTKILVADEPTGNLDSVSAEGIVDLLTEIAADKLVIVVTHNYDQFRDHATRVIKMHDGKIVEDTGAAAVKTAEEPAHVTGRRSARAKKTDEKQTVSYGTQLRLGVRNTFNLPAKFLLLLLVFMFVVSSVSAQYVTVKKQKDTVSEQGWNDYFTNYDPKRIVVEKNDHSAFTRSDFEAIENAPHVERLIREDMLYDSSIYIENDEFSFYGFMLSTGDLEKEPDLGSMPEADNEVVLAGYDDGWTFGEKPEALIGKTYTVTSNDGSEHEIKIAGIVLKEMDDSDGYVYSENSEIYLSDKMVTEMRKGLYASNSKTTMLINGSEETLFAGEGGLMINDRVPEGYILLPTSYDGLFEKGYAAGNEVRVRVHTLYYDEELKLMIMGTYGEKTFEKKTGLTDLSEHDGEIYINPMDYRRLYEKGCYQVSVFVDDTKNMDGMKDMLERGGYHVLVLRDHIYNFMNQELISIIQLPMAVFICLAVFFIAYFVIRLILKSRGIYFATVRMLGMGKKPVCRVMRVELILVCAIAYALFLVFIYLNRIGIVNSASIMDHLTYLTLRDYIVLAAILLLMAVLISARFMRSIFRSSAMGVYREEA